MTPVAIALGSNVGDSLKHMQDAVAALRGVIRVDRISGAYKTEPMYVENQPAFLNAALIGATNLGPRTLLKQLKEIESQIGRQTRQLYGPREIDLDLIAYGSLRYTFTGAEKTLVLPHPKTFERRFVLMPLSEIAPSLKLIGLGTVEELLKETKALENDVLRLDNAQL